MTESGKCHFQGFYKGLFWMLLVGNAAEHLTIFFRNKEQDRRLTVFEARYKLMDQCVTHLEDVTAPIEREWCAPRSTEASDADYYKQSKEE